jgi:IMP dehydrogenase
MGTTDERRVADVMSSPVETISSRASVREAATVMRENGFNALLVPGGQAGIVTSTDVLDVVVEGEDPGTLTVGDVMTAPVESVSADLRLGEAAAMMTNYDINHLPVIGDDRDYVGIVSSTDLRETLV